MPKVSDQVRNVMAIEKISESELKEMIKRAAIVSTTEGVNRRFHHWLFNIVPDEDTILMMVKDAKTCIGKGDQTMEEECPVCEGIGCKKCNYWGVVDRLFEEKVQLFKNS